jgi:hypothetical protein
VKPKEGYWIGAKGGLLDEKHYQAMGESVWLFLYLLLRQTSMNEQGEGIVLYGNPLTREQIASDTGWSKNNIRNWTRRLVKTQYIRAVRSGNDGCVFFVRKAKSKVKNPRPDIAYFPAALQPNGNYVAVPQRVRSLAQVVPQKAEGQTLYGTTSASIPAKNQIDAQFPTSSIPKHLFNYNNTAKFPVSHMSENQRRERQEQLRLQAKEILRKYAPKGEDRQATA